MKKIVALILALVMVMGLATVASAATTNTYENKAVTMVKADGSKVDVSTFGDITKYDAVKNTQTVNGVTTTTYAPAYYTFENGSMYYYECDKSVAKYMLTIKNVGTVYVLGFNATLDAFDATPASVYTAPEEATCGKVGADEDVYVVVDGKYYATEGVVAKYALVNGNMVIYYDEPVDATAHQLAAADALTFDAKTGKITSVKCSVCKEAVAVYAKAGSFDGKTYVPAFNDGTQYYYVAGAVASTPAVDTDKVESAETFDAGIAMYVGMSVMAAAGSAVVLKKKD